MQSSAQLRPGDSAETCTDVGQRAGMSPELTLQMGQNLNMSRRSGTLIAIGVFVAIVIVLIVLSAY